MLYIIRKGVLSTALAASVFVAGCGLDGPGVQPITGPSAPSEFALSVTLTATPDQLPRDGASQSTITVLVRDAQARPVSGQRLSVASSVGTVSQSDVVTNADGRATFTFTAPGTGSVGNLAVVQVVPISGNADNAVGRTVSILLTGISNSTAPTAAFTFSPEAPTLQEPVTMDATTSTDEGAQCRDACTYTWDFGGESTATGRVVTYRFRAVRTYAVKLTVTDSAGSSSTLTQNVTVATGDAPNAAFTSSPSSPGQFQTVQFNASSSTAGAGRTISSYEWQFGDGGTASGVTVTRAYSVLGTYQVTLTVTDNVGLKDTATNSVAVINGVTAAFTISPSPATTIADTFFDTEGSLGSDSGFGGRSPIVQYIWNFGDSADLETTANRVMTHRFTRTGTLTVTLTVVDSAGRRATTSRTVVVA